MSRAAEDAYLNAILSRAAVDTGIFPPVLGVHTTLEPVAREWANRFFLGMSPSGSFAKGTANKSGTDIDLFIFFSPETKDTLRETYNSLFKNMQENDFVSQTQNVSIKVRVGAYDVDLVPAKRQNYFGDDDRLYLRRADTWTKTNVQTHIDHVIREGW